MTEKERVYPRGVLKMISLLVSENTSRVKTKATVCVKPPPVEEVVDLGNDEGADETITYVRGVFEEGTFNRGAEGVVNIPEGRVEGWGGESGVAADSERVDTEGDGLE